MSLWDDYKAEMLFARDFPHGVPGDVWESADGPIKVEDMTTDHIWNCMRLIGEDDPWWGRFKQELDNRRRTAFHAI